MDGIFLPKNPRRSGGTLRGKENKTAPKSLLNNGIYCPNDNRKALISCSNVVDNPRRAKKIVVSVEGNISSGKSTFLEHYSKDPNFETLKEPVERWKNCNGHNVLDQMYRDPKRYGFTFQSYVHLTMLEQHLKSVDAPVKLLERSIHSARYCFVENLFNSGLLTEMEYSIMCELFQTLVTGHNVRLDAVVYLRATPSVCLERIKHRDRSEESGVTLDYLENLHDLYEDWLRHGNRFPIPAPVIEVDADLPVEMMLKKFDSDRSYFLNLNL